jgi:hypothetical protein
MKDYKKIVEKYPELFGATDKRSPYAMFGFECNIGWYDIIENACFVLYQKYANAKWYLNIIEQQLEDVPGYAKRTSYGDKVVSEEEAQTELEKQKAKCVVDLEKAKENLPKVAQIKEKFGSLRFYLYNVDDVSNAVTTYAEAMSTSTCEECGCPGKTYRMGWHRTLCPTHAAEQYDADQLANYEKELKEDELHYVP